MPKFNVVNQIAIASWHPGLRGLSDMATPQDWPVLEDAGQPGAGLTEEVCDEAAQDKTKDRRDINSNV